jgi:hypothetical protein
MYSIFIHLAIYNDFAVVVVVVINSLLIESNCSPRNRACPALARAHEMGDEVKRGG